jgi:hypothetical protein
MDQNKEFEAIKRRHETCQGVLAEDFGEHCHTDRATLITLVEAERARADKAEAELADMDEKRTEMISIASDAHLRIHKLQAELAALREAAGPLVNMCNALLEEAPDKISLGIFCNGSLSFGPGAATIGHLRALARAVKGEG